MEPRYSQEKNLHRRSSKIVMIATVSVCVFLMGLLGLFWRPINHTINGHSFVIDSAEEPTCSESGLTEGFHCAFCGYAPQMQQVVQAKGHDFQPYAVEREATCTVSGIEMGRCSYCGATEKMTVPAKGHQCITESGFAPSCSTAGESMCIYCSACGYVVVSNNVIPPLGHSAEIISAVQPTCEESGWTEGKRCTTCRQVFQMPVEIQPAGHFIIIDAAVDATCTMPGLTEGSHCSSCNKIIINQVNTPIIDHVIVADAAVAPTNFENGLTEGSHCTLCGKIISEQQIVPAIGSLGLQYNLNNDGQSYSVVGIGSCPAVDILIPATYNSLPVTHIGANAFSYCSSIVSVKIQDGVTSIDRSAFRVCVFLAEVTIPNSVTYIGDDAFAHCMNLKKITFLGTISQWNAVEKATGWDENTQIYLDSGNAGIRCIDGTAVRK